MSPPGSADERIHAAYTALREGRFQDALDALDALALADRPGAQGRVHAFRAQALEGLGRVEEAERQAADAVRFARKAGEDEGVAAVRALHQRLLQGLAAKKAAAAESAADAPLADTPDEVLLARTEDAAARAALLVRKANALVDAGRRDEAVSVIHLAVSWARRASDPREEVFARLCEVRATPGEAARILAEAHAVADTADDFNLITAVARAARAAGVRLAPPTF